MCSGLASMRNNNSYPATNFHFRVDFSMLPAIDQDMCFQSVTGLSVNIETEDYLEGGENRFVHKLPTRSNYTSLQLKRGILVGSQLIEWVRQAIEDFVFKPLDITVSLLNEHHKPVVAWHVINAYPKSWSVNDFDAQANELAIETLEFHYNYFKSIRYET